MPVFAISLIVAIVYRVMDSIVHSAWIVIFMLAAKALAEKLSRADIKKAVGQWRPDRWRV